MPPLSENPFSPDGGLGIPALWIVRRSLVSRKNRWLLGFNNIPEHFPDIPLFLQIVSRYMSVCRTGSRMIGIF
jgi:hypothetical protein